MKKAKASGLALAVALDCIESLVATTNDTRVQRGFGLLSKGDENQLRIDLLEAMRPVSVTPVKLSRGKRRKR